MFSIQRQLARQIHIFGCETRSWIGHITSFNQRSKGLSSPKPRMKVCERWVWAFIKPGTDGHMRRIDTSFRHRLSSRSGGDSGAEFVDPIVFDNPEPPWIMHRVGVVHREKGAVVD
jgi:hypothetical protein